MSVVRLVVMKVGWRVGLLADQKAVLTVVPTAAEMVGKSVVRTVD